MKFIPWQHLLLLKVALLLFCQPLQVLAQQFEGVTVFGDSLSDNGNAFRVGGGVFPPSPPFFQGRFSNGPVWVENVVSELNLSDTSTNNAFGGATSGTANTVNPALPGLTTQLNLSLQSSPTANPDRLYVIWVGANDILTTDPNSPATTSSNVSTALQRLTGAGARNLIVPNLPDLGTTPTGLTAPDRSALLSQLSTDYNNRLRTSLQTLSQSNPNLSIVPVDIAGLFNAAIANPARFGFSNVTQPCLNETTGAVCANPDSFLFWDTLHPTAAAHRIIGDYVLDTLTAAQKIAPQADIALGNARRTIRDLNGRLLTLRTTTPQTEPKLGVFIQGDTNFGSRTTTPNVTGYNLDTKSLTLGADYPLTNNFAIGLALSKADSKNNLNNDLGRVAMNSTSISVYGSYAREKFYTDALFNYGWNNFDVTRNIRVTGFSQANANPSGNQLAVRVNTGYNFGDNKLSFGPNVGISYSKININGYTERDGDLLNLTVNPQTADSIAVNLGGNLYYAFDTQFGTIAPYVGVNYEHEFGNNNRQIVTELVTQPGIPIRTSVGNSDRDYLRLTTGVQSQFANNLSVVLGYETILGKDNFKDNYLSGQLRYQF
jgi:outer membrane lipase/esterase